MPANTPDQTRDISIRQRLLRFVLVIRSSGYGKTNPQISQITQTITECRGSPYQSPNGLVF
jgi:hypothetical protein